VPHTLGSSYSLILYPPSSTLVTNPSLSIHPATMTGSTKSVKSRSRSVSPPGSTSEVTSLLPSSRPKSPQQHLSAQPGSSGASTVTGHNRKISVSGRSVISNRNYGAVHRPSPTEQAPRVSQKGQRVGVVASNHYSFSDH
jgi:hypothetical protein